MVMQAYIDDSQDETGVYVLAGYISTAERWATFSREWEKMLSVGSLSKDGTRHFKMSEMALSPDRMSRVPGFHALINEHVIASLACAINVHDIDRALHRISLPDFPEVKIERADSNFKICFNVLMMHFHEQMGTHGIVKELIAGPVDFYFDIMSDQDQVLSGWNEFLSWVPNDERSLYGGVPKFVNDRQFLPVQAADFRAWWTRKNCVERGLVRGVREKPDYGYNISAKTMWNISTYGDEDLIFEAFKKDIRRTYGNDIRIADLLPSPDGASPMSLAWSYMQKRLRSFNPFR